MENTIYLEDLARFHSKSKREAVVLADQLFKKRQALRCENEVKKRKERSETWLFVCEGTKTETNYIESLKEYANSISEESPLKFEIYGVGKNTETLVKTVEDFYDFVDKNCVTKKIPYAKTFVVFDKDSFSSAQFNNAIHIARNKGYIPIWSNECFELWFILHFEYYEVNNGRQAYFDRLSKLLEEKYDKSSDIFKKIHSPTNLKNAVDASKKLNQNFSSVASEAEKVPCTQMFIVIEEINKKLKIDLTKQ